MYNVYASEKIIKVENSLRAIFGQCPCTIVQGLLSDFGATLKIHKKSKFDRNQLKLSTQHTNMHMHHKKL